MTYPSDYAAPYINNYLNATHSAEYYRYICMHICLSSQCILTVLSVESFWTFNFQTNIFDNTVNKGVTKRKLKGICNP